MVKINNISLKNFRNFNSFNYSFGKKANIFFGENGTGKTNLLESISLIYKGRGIRNSLIPNLIRRNEKNFLIKSSLEINKINYDIEIFTKKINDKFKKILNLNGESSNESNNFLNQSISFLIFLPEMERLFQSSPSYRRNFIDRLIFSENHQYNKLINKYKKNILERSKILQETSIDLNWINIIEDEISKIGLKIYELRNLELDLLNKYINKLNKDNNYQFIVNLELKDSLFSPNLNHEIYLNELLHSRSYDKKYGGSKIGPHKSDFVASINNEFDASQLSTGQQKTVVLMSE